MEVDDDVMGTEDDKNVNGFVLLCYKSVCCRGVNGFSPPGQRK